MPHFICLMLWLVSAAGAALELEGEFHVGRGDQEIRVLGTSDFARVQPVFAGFVATNPHFRLTYLQASSRSIDQAVRAGLDTEIDLVMSSAVDLQVKLVNDGFAQVLDLRGAKATHWRSQLVQIAVEPIVTLYHASVQADLESVKTRNELSELIRRRSNKALRVVIYDPEESGVGYLLSQHDAHQDARFWSLIEGFQREDFNVSCCSGDMIDAVISGERQLAYNVIESYVLTRLENAPDLRVLRFEDYQLALPRTAFVPGTADGSADAAALVRYILSDDGQLGLSPAVRLSILDETPRAGGPLKPIRLSPALIVHLDPVVRDGFFENWRRMAP